MHEEEFFSLPSLKFIIKSSTQHYGQYSTYNLLRRQRRFSLAVMTVTGCLHVPIVGRTGRSDPGYVRLVCQTSRTDRSDRL